MPDTGKVKLHFQEANVKIKWRTKDVITKINRATNESLAIGARIFAEEMKANIRPRRLSRPGGYGKVPGYVETTITAGRNKRGGHIFLNWPALVVHTGSRRSRRSAFVTNAIKTKRDAVADILVEI